MMFRPLLALSLLLGAIFPSAGAASPSKWLQVKSEHFRVVGDASENELRSAASRLELTRGALNRVFPFLNADRGRDLTAIVFADPAEYRSFKPLRSDGNVDDAVLGYYLAGEDHDTIAVSAGPSSNTAQVLSHEYAHWLLRSNYSGTKLPPWLEEGFAEYAASFNVLADGSQVLGGELPERRSTLRTHPLLPSSSFFVAQPTYVKGSDNERALFYAQAAATVHLIIESGTADMLQRILDAVASGESGTDAVARIYDLDAAKLTEKLTQYINAPFQPWTIRPRVPQGGPPEVSTLDDARSEAALGDLLMQMGRSPEAEPHLRRSIVADPKSPAAHTALGVLLARKGDHAGAARELETALSFGEAGVAVNFYYAYALSRGGEIGSMDERSVGLMRTALDRALASDPQHVPSMQLLSGLDLATENELPQAESLLRKATSLRPSDEQLQLMLARVLLRRERYGDASAIAKRLVSSADTQISKGAEEILDVSAEYKKASVDLVLKPGFTLPWEQPIVFLKRSWLRDAEIASVERERNNNNLNVMLGILRPDEQRTLAAISRVDCSSGSISYSALVDGQKIRFTSTSFERVRMSVLLEGSHSFKLDCGADLSDHKAVLTYRSGKTSTDPAVLTAIAFVPDDFTLSTPQQVTSHRMVVIEEDQLHSRGGVIVGPTSEGSEASRRQSIERDLRKPDKGEVRQLGTISRIDCGADSLSVTVVDKEGRSLVLASTSQRPVSLKWFTTETAETPLTCGSTTQVANALVTYLPGAGDQGELRSVELLPAWFGSPDGARERH